MSPTADRGHVVIDQVTHRYGRNVALEDVELDITAGEFVTFLGPSGCGKTTLLRIIAGFVRPSEGCVVLDGVDITKLPPNRRPVNLVFQRPMMFPHLDVFENVAFGLRVARLDRAEIQARVTDALRLVRLEGFERRRASELSGGQMQRISLARALVNRPGVLLLDEPLSALDLKIRLEMEAELRRLHRETGATFVFVTHDQGEALSLSDRVVVFEAGRIRQVGPPTEIYRRPQSRFAAEFVGDANVVPVEIERDGGRLIATFHGHRVPVDGSPPPDGAACLVIRAERVRIVDPPADGSGGVLPGTIVDRAFRGSGYSLRVAVPGVETPFKAEVPVDAAAGREVGDRVGLEWSPDAMSLIPAESS